MNKFIGFCMIILLVPFLFANNKTENIYIYFETFGGDKIETINIREETIDTLPNNITRSDGAIFLGWYDSLLFNNKITNINSINSSTILFALWNTNYHFEIIESVEGLYGVTEFGYFEHYIPTGSYMIYNNGDKSNGYNSYSVLMIVGNNVEIDEDTNEAYYPLVSRHVFTGVDRQQNIYISEEEHIELSLGSYLNFKLVTENQEYFGEYFDIDKIPRELLNDADIINDEPNDVIKGVLSFLFIVASIVSLTYIYKANKSSINKKKHSKDTLKVNNLEANQHKNNENTIKPVHSNNRCSLCDNNAGYWSGGVNVSDGIICTTCLNKAGINRTNFIISGSNKLVTIKDIYLKIEKLKQARKYHDLNKPDNILGNMFKFYEKDKILLIIYKNKGLKLIEYKNIMEIELIENKEQVIKGGVTSTIVGGMIAGKTGAIVGSNIGRKKTSSFITSRILKIRLKNDNESLVSLNLLKLNVNVVDQIAYKILNIIDDNRIKEIKQGNSTSEEILKMSELLQKGIITEEEFKKFKDDIFRLE